MTDQDIIEIISEGIVDGTDMDCTVKDQARAVLKALRDAGVFKAEWERGRDAAADECDRMRASYARSAGTYAEDDPMRGRIKYSGAAVAVASENIRSLNWEPPQ